MGCYFCLLVENRLNLKCTVVAMISLHASVPTFWQSVTCFSQWCLYGSVGVCSAPIQFYRISGTGIRGICKKLF